MRSGDNGFGRWIGREGAEVTATLRRLEIVLGFPGSGMHKPNVIRDVRVVNRIYPGLWNFPVVIGLRLR
jgi:hypothetical protein